jgi:hypothetical protein
MWWGCKCGKLLYVRKWRLLSLLSNLEEESFIYLVKLTGLEKLVIMNDA